MSHEHDHEVSFQATDAGAADNAAAARQYFRSLEQLADTPEYRAQAEREFPEGASEWNDEFSRRRFLGLVAASVALAGLQSCRKPYRKILPFAAQPEGITPGIPTWYATAFVAGGYGYGTLVRSNDGRPTKVEGNKLHPSSRGGANQYMQADVLSLYDPARSTQPIAKGGHASGAADHGDHGGHGAPAGENPAIAEAKKARHDLESWLTELCASSRQRLGEGVRFLLEPSTSPTLRGLIEKKAKQVLPKATFHYYAPINRQQELEGSKIAFGNPLDTHLVLDKADCVMSFGADFLGLATDALANARRYASKRKITDQGGSVSRLYVAESTYTVTGASADHRFRLPACQVADAALALAARLFLGKGSVTFDGLTEDLKNALRPHLDSQFKTKKGTSWIDVVASDLIANRGRSCVVAGASQPPVVHAVVHAINKALGNQGQTVHYRLTDPALAVDQARSIRELAADLDAGKVETLFCLGTNPVYQAPAELDFGAKIAKAKNKIHLGLHYDETAQACDWHVNQAHDLEAWGDIRAYDGTLSVVQPLIAPLYDGVSVIELLAQVLGLTREPDAEGHAHGYELVHNEMLAVTKQGDFETVWAKTLRDGVADGTEQKRIDNAAVNGAEVGKAVLAHKASPAPSQAAFEITFHQDSRLYDGRFSNNAWLMEMPDPLSKLTWDNAALMSRTTAKALGVKNEDCVKITLDGKSLEIPVFILPGQAEFSIALTFGYGRVLTDKHVIAQHDDGTNKPYGTNVFRLRTSAAPHVAQGAKVERTGNTVTLAPTQDHGAMEQRPIVREGTLAAFNDKSKKDSADFAYLMSPAAQQARVKNLVHEREGKDHGEQGQHGEHPAHEPETEASINTSLWPRRDFEKESPAYQWGMVIDLNSCTGCNACVVACQAENNVPTVGKDQVRRSREMHWLRIDRYFGGLKGKGDLIGEHQDQLLESDTDPAAVHMPVPCMQCENAPCESVCPVMATTHTAEGLNDMTYNRCVGTRYCSNNCPYKVRRFNFLAYTNHYEPAQQMVFNPDVTVRSRGVMEKCTYCVQRINAGKLAVKKELSLPEPERKLGKKLGDSWIAKDDVITPACAQTCPTDAITFGNLQDKTSRVSKLKTSKLNYAMLGDLNTLPRTTYLAKIRNPHPELAEQ